MPLMLMRKNQFLFHFGYTMYPILKSQSKYHPRLPQCSSQDYCLA